MTHAEPLLQVHDLRVDVGGRHVLKSISLDVPAGALVVLMGANGSGKSTLGLTLAGHPRYSVVSGQVRFGGQDLLAMSPEARARRAVCLVPGAARDPRCEEQPVHPDGPQRRARSARRSTARCL